MADENPLSIPMLWGWARPVSKKKDIKNPIVNYRTPCGRMLRNMYEVHLYLRLTGSQLGVDLFSFDCRIECFKEFEPDIVYTFIDGNPSFNLFQTIPVYHFCVDLDITSGVENVKLSCVSSFERSEPPVVKYTTSRIPRDGVEINMKPEFLVCCDCTDDCQDKERCQCWQLTIQVKNKQFRNVWRLNI